MYVNNPQQQHHNRDISIVVAVIAIQPIVVLASAAISKWVDDRFKLSPFVFTAIVLIQLVILSVAVYGAIQST